MAHYLYRKNGGKVEGMSVHAYTLSGVGATYYDQVENPTAQDGEGLAPPKVYLGGVLRNATAEEIAAFAAKAKEDDDAENKSRFKKFLDDGDHRMPLFKALATITMDELNILRQWVQSFKVEVAAASSLADLKTRVASLPELEDRTAAQLKTAIKNRVDSQS